MGDLTFVRLEAHEGSMTRSLWGVRGLGSVVAGTLEQCIERCVSPSTFHSLDDLVSIRFHRPIWFEVEL